MRSTITTLPLALIDDIHLVRILEEEVIRHLNFYRQPLEALMQRKQFDIASGPYKIMDISTKSKERA